jgi:hypothetical protein
MMKYRPRKTTTVHGFRRDMTEINPGARPRVYF